MVGGWEVRGRLLLRLVRWDSGGGWCLRIGVLGGVFLGFGNVFSSGLVRVKKGGEGEGEVCFFCVFGFWV